MNEKRSHIFTHNLLPEWPTTMTAGQYGQIACLLEVIARKPGNVHRNADLPGLHFIDFLMSAMAISGPLDRAASAGIGRTVFDAIAATRGVVATNTNLGIILLLAPLAAVPDGIDLVTGVEKILAATTVDDAHEVYRAIRLAQPGGLGEVADQDVASEPTATLREVMSMAAGRDLVARQYLNGFHDVLEEAVPALRASLGAGQSLETAIIGTFLRVLSRYQDSLITRKHAHSKANNVSRRAAKLLEAGWPDHANAWQQLAEFDSWLRHPDRRYNPGTTADLVTAALFVALRNGTIKNINGSDFA